MHQHPPKEYRVLQLFYDPLITSNLSEFILNEKESHHLIKVMRLNIGDKVHITNGIGELYMAKIFAYENRQCILNHLELKEKQESKIHIHLGIGNLKKADRMEWLVEKAVENKCFEITPLITRFTEKKKCKIDRLNKIAIAAMKQSCSLFLPIIHEATEFKDFIQNTNAEQKIIADKPSTADRHILNQLKKTKNIVVLAGPEGGFSEEEIQFCIDNGFETVNLGSQRLRSETAGLVSVILINAFFESI